VFGKIGGRRLDRITRGVWGKPPPKLCNSPGAVLRQKIGTPDREYFIRGSFPSLITVIFFFGRGKPRTPKGTLFGRVLYVWEGCNIWEEGTTPDSASSSVLKGLVSGGFPAAWQAGRGPQAQHRAAAEKNAYVARGKGSFQYAAAFFLLADNPRDALRTLPGPAPRLPGGFPLRWGWRLESDPLFFLPPPQSYS